MFKLVSAETIPLTKELVAAHLAMEASPTERDLDKSRVKYLKEKAEAQPSQLVTFNWARAQADGKLVRMNGQHSATMLSELNGAFPEGLHVHLDTYKVDTPEELAVLFRQFDARKSSRTAGDVAGAYQGIQSDLDDVLPAVAKLAVEGIAWHKIHIDGTMPAAGGDDQYSLFEDKRWHPFIRWMGELHSVKTAEMKSSPIAAAMFATYYINTAAARTFWEQVARGGVEFDDAAPSTVLDNWLKQVRDTDTKRRMKLKPANFYQACIFAWNAFRDEKPLKEIKFKVDKGLTEPVA